MKLWRWFLNKIGINRKNPEDALSKTTGQNKEVFEKEHDKKNIFLEHERPVVVQEDVSRKSRKEYFDFKCDPFLIYLNYENARGEITSRKVKVYSCRYKIDGLDFILHGFSGYCFLRKTRRNFLAEGIINIADGETGEIWESVVMHFMEKNLPSELLERARKMQTQG